jgi:hypothetical protein
MQDVTSEYVLRGVQGGFLALCIFVALIAFGFQAAGSIWRAEQRNRARMILAWALGVSLFSHVMMFIAVSYFGQIGVIFSLLLAMLGSLTSRVRARVPRRATRKAKPTDDHEPPSERTSLEKGLTGRRSARAR